MHSLALGPDEQGFNGSFCMKQLFSALKLSGGLHYISIGVCPKDEIKNKTGKIPFVPRRALSLPGECLALSVDTLGCYPGEWPTVLCGSFWRSDEVMRWARSVPFRRAVVIIWLFW